MSHSLIPERPVVVSPSLAASIGLEQAIMLQHLEACCQHGSRESTNHLDSHYDWASTTLATLARQLPFWNPAAVRRILQNLLDLGMILVDPFPTSENALIHVAINQEAAVSNKGPAKQHQQASLGAHRIAPNWQPDQAIIEQLQQHGIAQSFIYRTIDEFVMYWRERNEVSHAWSSKFLQHVTRRWQTEQQHQRDQATRSNQQLHTGAAIDKSWTPSEDAREILLRMGIHQNFIDDAVAEFVLYWQERGEAQATWNSKFVSHVKRQWAKYTHTLKNDTEPRPIRDNWQPAPEVYEVLAIANIDASFARSLLPEFVLYWRDKNELHHSWNTRFLQYVKYQWSRNYNSSESTTHGTRGQSDAKRRTRDRTLLEDLTDRSWAS